DRYMPQERAIEGPAVKPTIAPATAPTGPSTTAPDTAPRAASPARSCALASSEASSEPAISAATRNILMASPPQIMRPWDCENAAAERTTKRWNSTKKPASGIGCGRFGLFDGTKVAVICPTCQLARRVNSPARSAPPRRMLQSKATLGKRLPYGNLTGAERLHPPGIHVCMACDKLIRTPGADNDRGPSADIRSTTGKIAAMKNKAMIRMMVLVISIGTLSLTVARPSLAQNGIGGAAKTKQNAIGGASKPAPVIGGTAISAPAVTKPAVVGSMTKPASAVGAGKGGSIGNATA